MPNHPPPDDPPGKPAVAVLPPGTVLSRVHSRAFSATAFNPTPADPHWGGGRFDSTLDDPYGFLYAASDDECAICEALLRDLPLDSAGGRLLPRAAVNDRVLSRITVAADLRLVSLCDGKELARLGQGDDWLVACPSAEYGYTRRWGHAIRRWAPKTAGFVWRSRRDPSKRAYVLFEDRMNDAIEESRRGLPPATGGLPLDHGIGEKYLREILARYWATLAF